MRVGFARDREHAAHAVSGDAGIVEVAAVGGAGAHGRHDGNSRPHSPCNALDRAHDFARQRRRVRAIAAAHDVDGDLFVCHHPAQFGLHLFRRVPLQHAAGEGGDRALRQCVGGVAGVDLGGHAGGAHDRVVGRIARHRCLRGNIARIARQRGH